MDIKNKSAEICRIYDSGISIPEISDRYGISIAAVYGILIRNNVELDILKNTHPRRWDCEKYSACLDRYRNKTEDFNFCHKCNEYRRGDIYEVCWDYLINREFYLNLLQSIWGGNVYGKKRTSA
jgi:hypothetical protein